MIYLQLTMVAMHVVEFAFEFQAQLDLFLMVLLMAHVFVL